MSDKTAPKPSEAFKFAEAIYKHHPMSYELATRTLWYYEAGLWRPISSRTNALDYVGKLVQECGTGSGDRRKRGAIRAELFELATSLGQVSWPRDMVGFMDGAISLDGWHEKGPEWEPELREHAPVNGLRSMLPFPYAATYEGEPVLWLRFLDEVSGGDPGWVETAQRMAGYLLTQSIALHKLFVCWGVSRGGKGVFTNTLAEVVGWGQVAKVDVFEISQPGRSFWTSRLVGARMAIIEETRKPQSYDTLLSWLLQLSGDEYLPADKKNAQPFMLENHSKTVMVMNHPLVVGDSADALLNRLVQLQFSRSFKGAEDPHLKEKLKVELPYIWRWAFEGLRKLAVEGNFKAQPRHELEEYQIRSNPVGLWVDTQMPEDEPMTRAGIHTAIEQWYETETGEVFKQSEQWVARRLNELKQHRRIHYKKEEHGRFWVKSQGGLGRNRIGMTGNLS